MSLNLVHPGPVALPQLSAIIVAATCACGNSDDFQRHAAPENGGAAGAPGALEVNGASATAGASTWRADSGGRGGVTTGGVSAAAGDAGTLHDGVDRASAGAGGAAGAPAVECGAPPPGALYVDADTGVDSADCGAPTSPCRSVQAGIVQAGLSDAAAVVVGEGVYVESVVLSSPLELLGGWRREGEHWVALCPDEDPGGAATLVAPPTESRTLSVHEAGGRVRLSRLSVESKGTADPGESLYGVFATGASTELVLDEVNVWLAGAGAGEPGSMGEQGAQGGASCPPGDGAQGAPGSAAPATPPGAFGSEGYLPGDGAPGLEGELGHHGPMGSPATESGCISTDGFVCTTKVVTARGLPGCGGLPGQGGTPGKGGGSSIGLFVWDATVIVRAGRFAAGDGGDGGLGGDPGLGGPGSTGASESAACAGECEYIPMLDRYVPSGGRTLTSPGSRGGDGGPGSRGGQGAGGHSYAVFRGGQARVDLLGSTLIAGRAGDGETSGSAAEKNF